MPKSRPTNLPISRNEALERLREYRTLAREHSPSAAREMAISVLLDIIDDEHISFSFKLVTSFYDPLNDIPKILADEPIALPTVQKDDEFMERERRIKMNEPHKPR